jgi:hypothetical protein
VPIGWSLATWGMVIWGMDGAIAKPTFISKPAPKRACPTEVKSLVSQMLKDIPSYTNRAYVRGNIFNTYLMLASPPDFEPLSIGAILPPDSSLAKTPNTVQVFFTTLDRMHGLGDPIPLQQYHWLFLAPGSQGWQLKKMYTMTGPYPAGAESPTTPRDSTGESLALAIQDWFKDCQEELLP